MGEPSVVPGRELGVGRLVLGTATCVVEVAIIFVWSVELDLKKAVGGRILLEYQHSYEPHLCYCYYQQWWLL